MLVTLLFLVFLVLKLIAVIDWSWWWITAPLWGVGTLRLLWAVYVTTIVTRRVRRIQATRKAYLR
ncbi:membrane protein [Gordonia phage LastResort]|nr:membrane protein [Gordonia phage LastResort]QDM56248.1 membrane protein [Gordonia phage ReMo]QZD98721.1 membrane protein [Gordonia phage Looper]UAJ15564.1 membrane protein [Gordonia Phage Boohoo]UVD39820.1 membrane protein [Gordonia phage Anaysia]